MGPIYSPQRTIYIVLRGSGTLKLHAAVFSIDVVKIHYHGVKNLSRGIFISPLFHQFYSGVFKFSLLSNHQLRKKITYKSEER